MNPKELAAIRERVQKVPPAPWRVEDDERTLTRWILSENGELEIGLGYVGNRTEDLAAFIVHAREDIPALLREVERLRSELAERRAITLPLKEAVAAADGEQDQMKREMNQLHLNREQSRWVAGELEKHRDAYKADLDRLTNGIRALIARCDQGARDNGEYYERTAAKYEHGKTTVWDTVATELRALFESTTDTAGGAA